LENCAQTFGQMWCQGIIIFVTKRTICVIKLIVIIIQAYCYYRQNKLQRSSGAFKRSRRNFSCSAAGIHTNYLCLYYCSQLRCQCFIYFPMIGRYPLIDCITFRGISHVKNLYYPYWCYFKNRFLFKFIEVWHTMMA